MSKFFNFSNPWFRFFLSLVILILGFYIASDMFRTADNVIEKIFAIFLLIFCLILVSVRVWILLNYKNNLKE